MFGRFISRRGRKATKSSLSLGTGDKPQFLGIEMGHATDTTIEKSGSGDIQIEGNKVYRVGGTDVAIADGGTGAGTAQTAINALTAVSGATNEHVLTKDTSTGNAVFKAAAGGGGGTQYWRPQWSAKMYTKSDNFYYPAFAEGPNSERWSNTWSNDSFEDDWPDDWSPQIIVPADCTLTEMALYGNPTSTQTYQMLLGYGTPDWDGVAGNTTLTQVGSGISKACTSGVYEKMEATGLSVSLSKGDILVPQFRRTTTDTTAIYYFEGVFMIEAEFD